MCIRDRGPLVPGIPTADEHDSGGGRERGTSQPDDPGAALLLGQLRPVVALLGPGVGAVSYTHLDVYKRQILAISPGWTENGPICMQTFDPSCRSEEPTSELPSHSDTVCRTLL